MAIEYKLGEIEIKVQDNGIGIAEEDFPFIFDEFYRDQDASKRKEYGAGLGLSIVKQIVEMHDGKIAVSSQKGKDTTFRLIFRV